MKTSLKIREVLTILHKAGWRLVRQRGSHRQFKHPEKRGLVTVSGHPHEELAPGTLKSIFNQAGITFSRKRNETEGE